MERGRRWSSRAGGSTGACPNWALAAAFLRSPAVRPWNLILPALCSALSNVRIAGGLAVFAFSLEKVAFTGLEDVKMKA